MNIIPWDAKNKLPLYFGRQEVPQRLQKTEARTWTKKFHIHSMHNWYTDCDYFKSFQGTIINIYEREKKIVNLLYLFLFPFNQGSRSLIFTLCLLVTAVYQCSEQFDFRRHQNTYRFWQLGGWKWTWGNRIHFFLFFFFILIYRRLNQSPDHYCT